MERLPTWGSGLASATQKELLARRFAITPRKLWLYRDGDECVGVTGGWDSDYPVRTSPNPQTRLSPQLTQTNMKFVIPKTSYVSMIIGTRKKINLTYYKKLVIEIGYGSELAWAVLSAWPDKIFNNRISFGSFDFGAGAGAYEFDISQFRADYYIEFANGTGLASDGGKTAYINKIWLE